MKMNRIIMLIAVFTAITFMLLAQASTALLSGTEDFVNSVSESQAVSSVPSKTQIAHFTFETGNEGWQFVGQIPPFDAPISSTSNGRLGLNANGSINCFSFFTSPDVPVENNKFYRAIFTVSSSTENPDDTVQFRLRINQRGAWSAWDRVVNSYLGHAPSQNNPKNYEVYFDPKVSGESDNVVIFNFDIASFDANDNSNSWIYLEELLVEEVDITP